jgi:hypothetical protein
MATTKSFVLGAIVPWIVGSTILMLIMSMSIWFDPVKPVLPLIILTATVGIFVHLCICSLAHFFLGSRIRPAWRIILFNTPIIGLAISDLVLHQPTSVEEYFSKAMSAPLPPGVEIKMHWHAKFPDGSLWLFQLQSANCSEIKEHFGIDSPVEAEEVAHFIKNARNVYRIDFPDIYPHFEAFSATFHRSGAKSPRIKKWLFCQDKIIFTAVQESF